MDFLVNTNETICQMDPLHPPQKEEPPFTVKPLLAPSPQKMVSWSTKNPFFCR